MTRILVSGFEPFGGQGLNPTAKLIEALKSGQLRVPEGAVVSGVLLPVTFEEAFAKLETEMRAFAPDVILSLGQAGGRAQIEVERVAINCLDADIPDNRGAQPRDLEIEPGESAAYFTTLPHRELVDALTKAGVPVRVSNSAGTYVCNFLFYKLQSKTVHSVRRSGFVHVPFLPEQVSDRPGVPSLAFDQLKRALEVMLETLAR